MSLAGSFATGSEKGAKRVEGAVWPVTFASVWFDIHGSVIRVQSEWGMRFARILFGFGAVISGLSLLVGWSLFVRYSKDVSEVV